MAIAVSSTAYKMCTFNCMLELRHRAGQQDNSLASLTSAPLIISADNAGIPQEGTPPDHDGKHGN